MGFLKFSIILGVAVLLTSGNAQTPTPSPNFDCPDHNDSIHPDPEDCSKYYVCTNGLAWHEECAPGLLFDPTTLECNWPWLVTCFGATPSTPRPMSTTTPGPTPTQNPGTQEPSEEPSQGPSDPPTSPRPTTQAPPTTPSGEFQCPSPDGYFPHPTDCNAYYVCEGGHASVTLCPPGLHFDPILKVCNWPDEAGCTAGRR